MCRRNSSCRSASTRRVRKTPFQSERILAVSSAVMAVAPVLLRFLWLSGKGQRYRLDEAVPGGGSVHANSLVVFQDRAWLNRETPPRRTERRERPDGEHEQRHARQDDEG